MFGKIAFLSWLNHHTIFAARIAIFLAFARDLAVREAPPTRHAAHAAHAAHASPVEGRDFAVFRRQGTTAKEVQRFGRFSQGIFFEPKTSSDEYGAP